MYKKNKLIILFIICISFIGCASKVPLINNETPSSLNISIANPRSDKFIIEQKRKRLSALTKINDSNLIWIRLNPEDESIVYDRLKELKSGLNYASCASILYLRLEGDNYQEYLSIDCCGHVWGKNKVFKGVQSNFWIDLNTEYF